MSTQIQSILPYALGIDLMRNRLIGSTFLSLPVSGWASARKAGSE